MGGRLVRPRGGPRRCAAATWSGSPPMPSKSWLDRITSPCGRDSASVSSSTSTKVAPSFAARRSSSRRCASSPSNRPPSRMGRQVTITGVGASASSIVSCSGLGGASRKSRRHSTVSAPHWVAECISARICSTLQLVSGQINRDWTRSGTMVRNRAEIISDDAVP